MTYSLRCRNSKCRYRRVSKNHPESLKHRYRCPSCGQLDKGWRIENRDYNKKDLCDCGKVPLYPHRKGKHPCCDHHPYGAYNQAKRAGIKDEDIPVEYLGRVMNAEDPCPF